MFCWTGYVVIPRCCRYFTGLIAPKRPLAYRVFDKLAIVDQGVRALHKRLGAHTEADSESADYNTHPVDDLVW